MARISEVITLLKCIPKPVSPAASKQPRPEGIADAWELKVELAEVLVSSQDQHWKQEVHIRWEILPAFEDLWAVCVSSFLRRLNDGENLCRSLYKKLWLRQLFSV